MATHPPMLSSHPTQLSVGVKESHYVIKIGTFRHLLAELWPVTYLLCRIKLANEPISMQSYPVTHSTRAWDQDNGKQVIIHPTGLSIYTSPWIAYTLPLHLVLHWARTQVTCSSYVPFRHRDKHRVPNNRRRKPNVQNSRLPESRIHLLVYPSSPINFPVPLQLLHTRQMWRVQSFTSDWQVWSLTLDKLLSLLSSECLVYPRKFWTTQVVPRHSTVYTDSGITMILVTIPCTGPHFNWIKIQGQQWRGHGCAVGLGMNSSPKASGHSCYAALEILSPFRAGGDREAREPLPAGSPLLQPSWETLRQLAWMSC